MQTAVLREVDNFITFVNPRRTTSVAGSANPWRRMRFAMFAVPPVLATAPAAGSAAPAKPSKIHRGL
jgi:hypothetical protein